MNQKGITVCVPAFCESKHLGDLFSSLWSSDLRYFEYEILLCDSGSGDGTADLVDCWKDKLNLHMIVTKGANASQNLNAAIQVARYSIFCWIAPRSRVSSNYFSTGFQFMQANRETVCAVGPSVNVLSSQSGLVPSAVAILFMSPFLMGPSKWKASTFYKDFAGVVDTIYIGFFWLEDLVSIKGFDVSLDRKQDIDMFQRLQRHTGKKFFNTHELKAVYLLKHDSIKEISSRAFTQGRYAGKYSTPVRVAHILPLTCFIAFLVVSTFSLVAGLMLVSFYLFVIMLVAASEALQVYVVAIALLVFPLVHVAYVLGNLYGFCEKIKGFTQ